MRIIAGRAPRRRASATRTRGAPRSTSSAAATWRTRTLSRTTTASSRSRTRASSSGPARTSTARRRGAAAACKGLGQRDEDFVSHLFTASAHDYLLFFTDHGRCYWLRVFQVPEGSPHGQGPVGPQPRPDRAGRRHPGGPRGEEGRLPLRGLPELPLRAHGDARRARQEDAARGVLARPRRRHHRDRHRRGRRARRGADDGRRRRGRAGVVRRARDPLCRGGRPLDGPQEPRRARDAPRRGRDDRRHGGRAGRGDAHPHGLGQRLRQADRARRASATRAAAARACSR